MKNIITIKRINDNARRIYELPEEYAIDSGAMVQVETSYGDRLYGIALTPSAVLDDATVQILRATLGMNPAGDFLRVKAIITDTVEIDYPEAEESAEDE